MSTNKTGLGDVYVLKIWRTISAGGVRGCWTAGTVVGTAASTGGGYASFGYLGQVAFGEGWTRGICWVLGTVGARTVGSIRGSI